MAPQGVSTAPHTTALLKANALGARWEELAEQHLSSAGLRLVARNFHCRLGEIDLVMRTRHQLVFIEVRYRRSATHGSAVETVSYHKQLKIQRAAGIFLSRRPALAEMSCRFDVVGISGSPGRARIEWLQGAFEAT